MFEAELRSERSSARCPKRLKIYKWSIRKVGGRTMQINAEIGPFFEKNATHFVSNPYLWFKNLLSYPIDHQRPLGPRSLRGVQ